MNPLGKKGMKITNHGVCKKGYVRTPRGSYISLQEENGVQSKSTFDRLSLAIESQGQPFISIVQSPGSAGLNQKGHRRPKRRRDLITKFDRSAEAPNSLRRNPGVAVFEAWHGIVHSMGWGLLTYGVEAL